MNEGVNYVAWWGAVVATIVAGVNLYDRLNRRPIPTVSALLTTIFDPGNQIAIINGGQSPIMISSWELFWAVPKRFDLTRGYPVAHSDDEELYIMTLGPFEHHKFTFAGPGHFDWGYDKGSSRQLYLELAIVGRKRPVILHVFNPHPDRFNEPWTPRRLLPHSLRSVPTVVREDDGRPGVV